VKILRNGNVITVAYLPPTYLVALRHAAEFSEVTTDHGQTSSRCANTVVAMRFTGMLYLSMRWTFMEALNHCIVVNDSHLHVLPPPERSMGFTSRFGHPLKSRLEDWNEPRQQNSMIIAVLAYSHERGGLIAGWDHANVMVHLGITTVHTLGASHQRLHNQRQFRNIFLAGATPGFTGVKYNMRRRGLWSERNSHNSSPLDFSLTRCCESFAY